MDVWNKRYIFAENLEMMTIITGREFRTNQGKYIGMAHRGERVVISSKSGFAELTPISKDDKEIKEHLVGKSFHAVAAKVRKEYKNGKGVTLSTPEEIESYLASL